MTNSAATESPVVFARGLQYQPVQHACSHFEARLMRPRVEQVTLAGSPCSQCAPQGRPVEESFATLAEVLAACEVKNVDEGWKS